MRDFKDVSVQVFESWVDKCNCCWICRKDIPCDDVVSGRSCIHHCKCEFVDLVKEYVDGGCVDYSNRLGIVSMPDGYALLLSRDRSHFFSIKSDQSESVIHWDKWVVYRWIKADLDSNLAVH